MAALSVIICTHNPRPHLLARTLDALRRQTLPTDRWDLVVVDNASRDAVAAAVDLSWHTGGRVVREDELGLTAARVRGIRETSSELLVFVDDDNVLHEDYLLRAVEIAGTHQRLGCFGAGIITPEFEETPPPEVLAHTGMLALRTIERTHWSNDPNDDRFPWGPGLVVRRTVAEGFAALVGGSDMNASIGRRGASLASAEDELFGLEAIRQGFGKGLFIELTALHLIPRERTDFAYLLRLCEAQARSYRQMREWQQQFVHVPERPARIVDVIRHLARLRVTAAAEAMVSYSQHRRLDRHTALIREAWRKGLTT